MGEAQTGRLGASAAWCALVRRPLAAIGLLLALCTAVYLPGVLRLPAVDRTEVIYADTARQMVATGRWADPRYGDVIHPFRPPGTYWAQGVAATLAGPQAARTIGVYRAPSVIAVTLAVIALYALAAPLLGAGVAFLSAGLFAVAPLTVLVSQLAIAEGLSLLPATIAMLTLLRLYAAPDGVATRGLAVAFWLALGVAMLINALLVPIIAGVTVLALAFADRDVRWLKRTEPLWGVPLALLIAAPWLYVRAMQDGVPFATLDWREFLSALGGAQDMKLRAFPGTFLLAAVLGFLPGTALLAPAIKRLFDTRTEAAPRFLLAWIGAYLVYLELLSSKPGTYMVQTLFPAFAMAVALLVARAHGTMPLPKFHAVPWPPLAALFAAALFGLAYGGAGAWPPWWLIAPMLAVVVLFAASAHAARGGNLFGWAARGVAALGLFAITLLGGVLPSLDALWPARQLQDVAASCPPSTLSLVGFREPTGRFVLDAAQSRQTPDAAARLLGEKTPRLTIIEDRWHGRVQAAIAAQYQVSLPKPVACVTALNTMRGCSLRFRVYQTGAVPDCAVPSTYSCASWPPPPENGAGSPCD